MARLMIVVRVVLYSILFWFTLALLWMGLPSPSFEHSWDPTGYATRTLEAGKTLTRVYDIEEFFPYHDPIHQVQAARKSWKRSFALDFKYNRAAQVLRMGYAEASLKPPSMRFPHVSYEMISRVHTGDQDGINAPWFPYADATLLYWWIHRDAVNIAFRLRWTGDDTVEVWPDSQHWHRNFSDDPGFTPPNLQPLITLENYNQVSQAHAPFKVLFPSPPSSYSPSMTYPVRLFILEIIAPTGLLIAKLFNALAPSLYNAFAFTRYMLECLFGYFAIIAVLWLAKGKPPLEDFLPRFPLVGQLSSRVYPKLEEKRSTIWGSSGPIEGRISTDSNSSEDSRRFTPIRCVSDFFRSGRPLNDLLETFPSTRHLTQPMRMPWEEKRIILRDGRKDSNATAREKHESSGPRKSYSIDEYEDRVYRSRPYENRELEEGTEGKEKPDRRSRSFGAGEG